MPEKTSHTPNPATQEKWEAMPGDRDFYVVLHDAVGGVVQTWSHPYEEHGRKLTAFHATQGDPIYQGSCVPAKAFGVGADIQRLVDLGAIRQATPWEEEKVKSDFTTRGLTTEADIKRPLDGPGERVDEKGNRLDEAGNKVEDKDREKAPATLGGFSQPPKAGDKK